MQGMEGKGGRGGGPPRCCEVVAVYQRGFGDAAEALAPLVVHTTAPPNRGAVTRGGRAATTAAAGRRHAVVAGQRTVMPCVTTRARIKCCASALLPFLNATRPPSSTAAVAAEPAGQAGAASKGGMREAGEQCQWHARAGRAVQQGTGGRRAGKAGAGYAGASPAAHHLRRRPWWPCASAAGCLSPGIRRTKLARPGLTNQHPGVALLLVRDDLARRRVVLHGCRCLCVRRPSPWSRGNVSQQVQKRGWGRALPFPGVAAAAAERRRANPGVQGPGGAARQPSALCAGCGVRHWSLKAPRARRLQRRLGRAEGTLPSGPRLLQRDSHSALRQLTGRGRGRGHLCCWAQWQDAKAALGRLKGGGYDRAKRREFVQPSGPLKRREWHHHSTQRHRPLPRRRHGRQVRGCGLLCNYWRSANGRQNALGALPSSVEVSLLHIPGQGRRPQPPGWAAKPAITGDGSVSACWLTQGICK